ncbi:MAG TPA: hypothetical protein VGU02_15915 [Gaiellaceae bacterium]|nr:hypothetical protein [Gaiellaceae bacterium]
MFGSRFKSIVASQLDLFARENQLLLKRIADSLDEYNRAERDEAEELFGDYMDAHAVAAEILEEMRDHYARTLEDPDEYVEVFNRGVQKRWPVTATELD